MARRFFEFFYNEAGACGRVRTATRLSVSADQMNREIVHGMREFTTLKVDGACEEEKAGIEGHAETEEKDEVQRIAKVTRLRCMPARGPAQEETQTIIEGFSRRD